jgi:NAD-dependent deacetylase
MAEELTLMLSATFRGAGGLWESHRVEDVATPEAWDEDLDRVLRFYNLCRKAEAEAQPNAAHIALAKLEDRHEVTIITRNIDDLHKRAESSRVIHLHGETMKARSTCGSDRVVVWGCRDMVVADHCPLGSQLRPHVVWFGEDVPDYVRAIPVVSGADVLMVIGTSSQVYPAAGLVEFACPGIPIHVVAADSGIGRFAPEADVRHFPEAATAALPIVEELMKA